jgi:hypothetical protein
MSARWQYCTACGGRTRHGFPLADRLYCSLECLSIWRAQKRAQRVKR